MSKHSRIERLLRLNRFREEQATGVVHDSLAKQRDAAEAHSAAIASVDAIGEWKDRATQSRSLDIGVYSAALDVEAVASGQADERNQDLSQAREHTAQSTEALVKATTAVRVAETREGRARASAEVVEEKRVFDQTSDLWLNNREARQ